MSRDFDFMRRRRTNVRWASKLPGPRLQAASDGSDDRGHIGEIIFIGFDGKPIMVGVNYAGRRNEFTGRNGMAFIDSRHLWAVINAARKADGEVNP